MKLICLIYCIQKIIKVQQKFAKKKIVSYKILNLSQKMSSPEQGFEKGQQMLDVSIVLCLE